jgi:DNA-binding cell septation regulator SpoVG
VASDKGTGAEDGKDTLESVRSQMRKDIKRAIREELDEIENEYEIVYE